MLWFAELAAAVDKGRAHVVNDSKTPSGRAHVGALRGPLIHDAVFRALKNRDIPVKYLFGVDDFDPVDEIPAGQDEHFTKYLGQPLCNVPSPPGSKATDMAEHFIAEFFGVFTELGIEAEHYRMRDVYRSGRFDEAIDRILSHAADVRRIYKEVSGSEKGADWFPFQVVCENCGRIGTTDVRAYDGKEVTYTCKPNLVKWAKGCGHAGKISPFGGRGKLPWKLEWVAKWKVFGVTIEGAGKDHGTKGGSRDVAAACLKQIFDVPAPLNIPYEFFLAVGGAKMSSSKGIGATARQVADFLPPEVLRYLILRTQPKTPVTFSLTEEFLVKLFNDFDRLHKRAYHDAAARDDEKELLHLCDVGADEGDYFVANFQLVLTFAQMPHVDLVAEMEKRKGAPLSEVEREHLRRRIVAAETYLRLYATDEERIRLQDTLPARASELTASQRGFAHLLAAEIDGVAWEDDALQAKVFDTARRTPIDQGAAFKAFYRLFLDKEQGPRAGALMAVLERAFVKRRLGELPLEHVAFLKESASTVDDIRAWLAKEGAQAPRKVCAGEDNGRWWVDVTITLAGDKTALKRAVFDSKVDADAFERSAT